MKTLPILAAAFVIATQLTLAADKPDAALATARQLNEAFVSVAERVRPAVVSIYSEKVIKLRRPEFNLPFEEFFRYFGDQGNQSPRRQQPQQPRQREFRYHQGGMGSGIIIDKEGYIITNNHVVDNVDEIKVTLADKRTFEATVIGTDPKTDLAVIKIKGKVPADLPIAELGDSDAVRIGEMVLAIGAPFGYAQTVTQGIISATGRSTFSSSDNYEDFIQTDAAINPGKNPAARSSTSTAKSSASIPPSPPASGNLPASASPFPATWSRASGPRSPRAAKSPAECSASSSRTLIPTSKTSSS